MDYKLFPINSIRSAVAVAVDVEDKMLYWSDSIYNTIVRTRRDIPNHAQVIVRTGSGEPGALAIDWIGRKLYWADWGKSTLFIHEKYSSFFVQYWSCLFF